MVVFGQPPLFRRQVPFGVSGKTMDAIQQSNKVHRKPKDKNKEKPDLKGKNPKAFVSQSGAKAARLARRKVELDQQRLHVPAIDRTFNGFAQGSTSKSSTLGSTSLGEEGQGPPPVIVGIIGPAGVGKSTLVRSLVRRYTKITMSDIKGPVTVVSGEPCSFCRKEEFLRW